MRLTKLTSVLKVILGGVLLGMIIHFVLITWSYHSLKSSIRNSRFASIIFKQDPSIGSLYQHYSNPGLNKNIRSRNLDNQLTWRIFVNLGILDWSSDTLDVSRKLNTAITKERESISSVTTVRHSLKVAQSIANTNWDEEKYEERLENIIVASLAKGPKAFDKYEKAVVSSGTQVIPDYSENYFAFLAPRKVLGWLWGEKSNQSDIVNLLFLHSGIAEKFDRLPDGDKDGDLEPTESYRQINEYFQRLYVSIHDDPEVIAAQNWFTILEGPEQFFMYIVFSIGLLLLIQNLQIIKGKISSDTKSAKFSIVFYRWIQIALPSLGFIGTKRGLSEALGKADTIVRSNTQINQALAVSHVSETMGIAFTSTLVGLILLMLLLIFELFIKYNKPEFNE